MPDMPEDLDQVIPHLARFAWQLLSDPEANAVWDAFEERFAFEPSCAGVSHGIREPMGSVTYDLANIRIVELEAATPRHAFVRAFRRVVADGGFVWVLDWNHDGFRFFPHAEFKFTSVDDWPVSPIPDGDYHIFVSADLEMGVFGHPWRNTLCVWGDPLVAAFADDPQPLFRRPIRRTGIEVWSPGRR